MRDCPFPAIPAQRGLCLELLVLLGGRREARRDQGGTQRFLGPKETGKASSCQGRGTSTDRNIQAWSGGERKPQQNHEKLHNFIPSLCGMTTLISKADYRDTAPAPSAPSPPSASRHPWSEGGTEGWLLLSSTSKRSRSRGLQHSLGNGDPSPGWLRCRWALLPRRS